MFHTLIYGRNIHQKKVANPKTYIDFDSRHLTTYSNGPTSLREDPASATGTPRKLIKSWETG